MYSHSIVKYKVRCKYKALGTQQMPKPDTCADDAVDTVLVGLGLLVDLRQYASKCQLHSIPKHNMILTHDP